MEQNSLRKAYRDIVNDATAGWVLTSVVAALEKAKIEIHDAESRRETKWRSVALKGAPAILFTISIVTH